jgi:glycosyltransferase involved in cell wall biosynthesis
MTSRPALSVVIIGRNEGLRLVQCLESVANMRPLEGGVEVIYVDSASTDDSIQNATERGAVVLCVTPERPCASIARNAGWRASSAPIVLFLDGDTILHPDFAVNSIAEFNKPDIAVVFGNRREIYPNASIFNRVLDLDWIGPFGLVSYCGGDALMRRDVLERVDGYDEQLIAGEEPELCLRIRALGYKVLHIDRPMVLHDLAITRFSQYWRRNVRSGYAYAEISSRFSDTNSPLWRFESHHNLIHGVSLLTLLFGGVALSVVVRAVWPILVVIALVSALALRTAARSKWKSTEFGTRLLYGFHSHLVHIPILVGQLKYQLNRLRGRRERLMEYKDTPEARPSKRISV